MRARSAVPIRAQSPTSCTDACDIDTAGRSIYCDEAPCGADIQGVRHRELLRTRAVRVVTKQHIVDHLLRLGRSSVSNAVEVLMHGCVRSWESSY